MPKLMTLVLIGVFVLLLAGCIGARDMPDSAALSIQPESTQIPPVSTESPIDPQQPVTEEEVDFCLDCHTDQQALIDTAKTEEEVINENEGEG